MLKGAPQPTDIDEKLIALRRRTAVATKPREKAERPVADAGLFPVTTQQQQQLRASPKRPHQHAAPQNGIIQREADPEEFSRKLNISTSSSPRGPSKSHQTSHSKLYNPDRDPIPMRRTVEPESMETPTASRSRHSDKQLFDPRKDNPMRLSVLQRPAQSGQRAAPTPKSSGDYSASASSYAPSQISSSFTLSSNTDGSSASSALFDRQDRPREESTNAFAASLKKTYRRITDLEAKIQKQDGDDDNDSRDNSRILLKGKGPQSEADQSDTEMDKWQRRIDDHKNLAEAIHLLLKSSLAPSVPASLRNIPIKYNIIARLWTNGFHKILENLRRASFSSALALEHLQDFIYFAYAFYTSLLEEPPLEQFKSNWLEALGDLARYRMKVAEMINSGSLGSSATKAGAQSTIQGVPKTSDDQPDALNDNDNDSIAPAARIDDSPSPSVGIVAARAIELEPEVERWRSLARDWYGRGLSDQPGTGKLHHHLGMLSREVPGEELRAIYHFVKSMTTLHPFSLARESVLSIWSPEAQAKRQQPDARVSDLFVLLHGMLFTNIQLDDFRPTLQRFVERLELEGAEERVWTMMAVVNISAILEYNKPNSVLKKCGGVTSRESAAAVTVRLMEKSSKKEDDKMEVDGDTPGVSSPPTENDVVELPMAFKLATELTFSILSHVLRRPLRKNSTYAKSRLNPYLPIILTFLSTVLKHDKTLEIMEKSVPWTELAQYFTTIPRTIMNSQNLMQPSSDGQDRWPMITSGCTPPIPEDWCLRGMEWVGRKVFERGYWKGNDDRKAEIDVLDEEEVEEMDDGRIEGEDESTVLMRNRYIRVIRAGVTLAGTVNGLTWVEGTRDWKVEGDLAEKVAMWKEEDAREKEEEERRKMGTRWADDSMDVDDEHSGEALESSDEDDEFDTPEIRELKERRRQLQNLLKESQMDSDRPRPRRSRRDGVPQSVLPIQAGYTVLVIDTNVLLSSLSTFSSLVESKRWTVLVPLPVVMELDGLKSNLSSQLSEAADHALTYITSHIRTHSLSLKVQTSKGNYLPSLNVRTEEVDFAPGRAERSMDDLILKTAIWHEEHWADRSAMLTTDDVEKVPNAVKVVLVTLDRNLRLKARSRQLPAAGEKDLALILSYGT